MVARGKDFIYSQDLNQVAQFVGLPDRLQPALSPAQLAARCTRILKVAEISVNQIPLDKLNDKLPGRDRSLQALSNHIFEIGAGFVKVANGADFTGRVAAAVPDEERLPGDLTIYSRIVASNLDQWFQSTNDAQCQRIVKTFYGNQSLHAVLERSTWHMTQHVRQIMMVLGQFDIIPREPLTKADLADLPLPENVWD